MSDLMCQRRGRHRLRSSTDGASAVEFALVIPVLLTLLFACLEFGMIAYTYNAGASAVREAGRQLATNQITQDQAEAVIQGALPSWVRQDAVASVRQSTPDDPNTNSFTLNVQFSMLAATPSHFLAWAYRNRTVSISLSMRQEPLI